MKFQLAINLERVDDTIDMQDVAKHTLEMVQMADANDFNIVWAAEHHALEMTIAPNPFQILTWWGTHTNNVRLGTGVAAACKRKNIPIFLISHNPLMISMLLQPYKVLIDYTLHHLLKHNSLKPTWLKQN